MVRAVESIDDFEERKRLRLEAHRKEVARLRMIYGDPLDAIAQFMRDHFDEQAARVTFEEYMDNELGMYDAWEDH